MGKRKVLVAARFGVQLLGGGVKLSGRAVSAGAAGSCRGRGALVCKWTVTMVVT